MCFELVGNHSRQWRAIKFAAEWGQHAKMNKKVTLTSKAAKKSSDQINMGVSKKISEVAITMKNEEPIIIANGTMSKVPEKSPGRGRGRGGRGARGRGGTGRGRGAGRGRGRCSKKVSIGMFTLSSLHMIKNLIVRILHFIFQCSQRLQFFCNFFYD